jgi:hypothetical protein
MSRKEKLLNRFLERPNDFTYDELRKLMNLLGYDEVTRGKTSGSRVAFIHTENSHIIRLHKPHPGNELKQYQIGLIINELKGKGIL